MFGRKNKTLQKLKGRIINPYNNTIIHSSNNELSIYSKYDNKISNLDNIYTSLIMYLKMNDNATIIADYSKNNNNATGINCSLNTTNDITSISFNGTSSYITKTAIPALYTNNKISFSFWINSSVLDTTSQTLIRQDNNSNNCYFIRTNGTNIQLIYENQTYTGFASSLITDNIWHHIVITADFTGDNADVKFYLNNNTPITSINTTNPTITQTTATTILIGYDASSTYYNGLMSEVMIYKKILSSNDVNNIYNLDKTSDININTSDFIKFSNDNSLNDTKIFQSEKGLINYNGILTTTDNKYLEDGLSVWYDRLIDTTSSTIIDKSGSNLNGTLSNIITNNNIISFNGSNSTITTTSLSNSTGNISISCWVKPTSTLTDPTIILGCSNITSATDNDWKLYADNSNSWAISINSGSTHSSSVKLPVNNWSHLVTTFNSTSNIINLYTNGVLNLSNTETASLTSNEPLVIGDGNTGDNEFTGYMKDIRVYDRIIEINEIIDLYNITSVDINERELVVDTTLPTANIYLKMTEGTSSNVINYGNDDTKIGNLLNGATWKIINNRKCVYFDGTNDLITYTHNTANSFIGALTLSFWINLDSSYASNIFYIISKTYYYEFEVRYEKLNKIIKFFFGNGTSTSGNYETWNLNYTLDTNVWYHIAITRNTGSSVLKDIKIYINGKQYSMYRITNTNITVNYSVADNSIKIAAQKLVGNYAMLYMNNLRIYNSELSANQINKIYYEELYEGSFNNSYLTTPEIKTITTSTSPDVSSSLNEHLIFNLTGQDSTGNTYVADYSLNRYHGNVAAGALTYSTSNASDINASNVLVFNGSTYLELDGTKNSSIDLKSISSEYSFSSWIYLSNLSLNNPLYTTNKDYINNGIYSAYIDTAGNLTLIKSNTTNDLIKFNTQFTTNQWYYIVINNYINKNSEIYYGTDIIAPTKLNLIDIAQSGATYYSNTYVKIGNGLDTTGSLGSNINGKMDDIKLYSTVLTPTEITTNWNTGNVNYFSTGNNSTDLLIKLDGEPGYYSANLNAITTAQSLIDNGLTATFTGVGNFNYNGLNDNCNIYLKMNEGSGSTLYNNGISTISTASLTGTTWANKNTLHNDNSIYFDGTDDYATLSDNATTIFVNALTVSCWLKPDNSNASGAYIAKGGVTTEYEFIMYWRKNSTDHIYFENSNSTTDESHSFSIPTKFLNTEWKHIVATRDIGTSSPAKTIKCYVNGELLGSSTGSNVNITTVNSNAGIILGARNLNTVKTSYFEGNLSQIRVYNRELKHSEILDLYNYTEGWSSKSKSGNFCYDLNTDRDLTITTNETNTIASGELWIKPSKFHQQTVLKSDYSTRSNGDVKLEILHADSNNSNLVANWHLFSNDINSSSDDVIDYVGNAYNLRTYNIDTTQVFNNKDFNGTLINFDGSSDYITNSINGNTDFINSINNGSTDYINNVSVCVWVYCDNFSSNRTILAINTTLQDSQASNSLNIHCLILSSTGYLRFQTRQSITVNNLDTTSGIIENTWTHLAFTYNKNDTNKKYIYINGKLILNSSTHIISKVFNDNNAKIFIGSFDTTPNNPYIGSITDLRIYNKTLSQSEIQEVMRQTMKPQLSIQLGGSITSISNNNSLIYPNTWHHLAYNYNSTQNYIKMYMNGELIASNLSLTNTTAMNSNIVLGNQSFEGQINNFNAYSRNLSDNEIKSIYLGLDRLKIHLGARNTSSIILYNKAKQGEQSYLQLNGSLSLIEKDYAFNNVLSFDGSTSYILLDPESNLWRNRSFTISMWIKPNSTGSGTNQHIFSRYLSSSYQSYYIAYDYTNNELDIVFSSGGTTTTTSISVLEDIYTFISVSFSNNNINIYINGKLNKTVEIPYYLDITIDSTLKTVIGDSSDLSNKYKGYIYDFRYYDTVLSSDAIRSVYSGYDLNTSTISKPELTYLSTDKTSVSAKEYVQPAKSSLVLHLNNYTTNIIQSTSDNSITATPTSMVASTTNFEFNGSSSYLTIANNTDLNITGTTITISMWINPDTLNTGDILLMKELDGSATSSSNNDYSLHIDASNKVVFKLTSTTVTSNTAISTNTWQHITALYDGTNMKVYINATQDNTTAYSSSIVNAASGDIIIGANSVAGELFDGSMRDIRIYDSAISTDDINLIYNAGLTTTGEFSIADNKIVENSSRYVFISKYLIDENNETADILGEISRDTLLIHYNNSNSGSTLIDISTSSIPGKMTTLRPNYLNVNTFISYSASNGVLSSSGLISASNGYINTNALLLNGATTSNIIITDGSNIVLNDWTFSTWYKLTDTSSKNVFLSRKETSKNFDIFIDSSDNEIKYKYNTTTVSSNFAIDTSLVTLDWNLLTVTKGQVGLDSNVVSIYNNGELISQTKQDTAFTTSATSLIIGTDNTDGFDGYLDDIRIYKSALNQVEVSRLYQQKITSGPIHYWLMEDETTSSSVRDLGSNGNNLKLQGDTSWNTTSANVKYGTRSLYFDGTGDYCSSASTGILGSQPRAIGMWIKRGVSTDPVSNQELLTYGNSSTAGEQFSVIINTTSNIQINLGSTSNITATTRLNDTDWHHITVLQLPNNYSITDTALKIFVDGNECTNTSSYDSTSINTKITGVNDLLKVGNGFNGYINEIKMYNYSLSQPELDVLYANKNHYMINL